MNSAIVPINERQAIDEVKALANIVLSLRDQVFKDGLDYGKIPGTGDKPTLLLPGMEKLLRALHLRPEYVALSQVEDFDQNRIFYRYECRLIDYDTGLCVSTAIGSANSYESKWRWRDSNRKCPNCGMETIKKSKFAPKGAPPDTEPGWYCYAKIGGCGKEYAANDPKIMDQPLGRIENPDIFDQMNTIDKIAQKRALSSAIKGAANVSEFFTVDLEDFAQFDTRPAPPKDNVIEGTFTDVTPKPAQPDDLGPLGDEPAPVFKTYICTKLRINYRSQGTQYIAQTADGITNIPLPLELLENVQVKGQFVVMLSHGVQTLDPIWAVTAALVNDAWVVQAIDTGVVQPGEPS